MKYISLPTSLKVIKEEAFYSCEYLKELTIPMSVDVIEKNAILRCMNLTKLTIPIHETHLLIGNCLFTTKRTPHGMRRPNYVTNYLATDIRTSSM